MKKLLSILFITISLTGFAQKFTVTPNGLRDIEDSEKSYLVLEVDGLSAKQLYDNALRYIKQNYVNPDEVLKGEIDGEFIKFDTYVENIFDYNNSGAKIPIEAKYTTELKFKDGKVRYEIIFLDMYYFNTSLNTNTKVLFTGGLFDGYIIYKKNGKLFKEETKLDIENHFNSQVNDILVFLKGESEDDSW